MSRASNMHYLEQNLQNLVYHFNPQTPWVYFRHGAPLGSFVERSRKKLRPTLKKGLPPRTEKNNPTQK